MYMISYCSTQVSIGRGRHVTLSFKVETIFMIEYIILGCLLNSVIFFMKPHETQAIHDDTMIYYIHVRLNVELHIITTCALVYTTCRYWRGVLDYCDIIQTHAYL